MAFRNTRLSLSLFRSSIRFILVFSLLTALALSGCGGGGESSGPPTNVGGGYTLKISGGTLNDGSGTNGLIVLATLRDDTGYGPSLPWTIAITGPGIPSQYPLTVEYQDGSLGSYMAWEWPAFEPLSGTYRATATNLDGSVTIYYDFSINSGSTLSRPAPSASAGGSSIDVTWPAVTGAGSYSYDVCSPASTCVSGVTAGAGATATFASLPNGDYLIRVRAYKTNRVGVHDNHTASPTLASQENLSEYVFSYPVNGDQTSTNYSLTAAGGVLDYDLSGPGGPIYGFAVWTSILYGTPNPNAAPAGDWNIVVKRQDGTIVADFIYPKNTKHYVFWYYGIEPIANETYTVEATYGLAVRTYSFTLSDLTPNLTPLTYSQISGTPQANNDITMTWTTVSGAGSYYLSLWAEVWDVSAKQYDYIEVWGGWVSANNAIIPSGSVPSGLACDAYVTAYEIDMTAASPPDPAPARADMSENYYGYPLSFLTP